MSKMWKNQWERGYITIEFSLLMPFIMGILFLLLYFMFYMMETGVIQGLIGARIYEDSLYLNHEEKNSLDDLESDITKHLYFTHNVVTEVKKTRKEVKVSVKGNIKIPLDLISKLTGADIMFVSRQAVIQTEDPIKIQRRRGILGEGDKEGGT